ncbi:DUF4245 domain-containing protein [Blastococcus sp. TF02A-30]|uniref:DUF4245 domain-containing protein n=1 Tax=Blastococcus sp. TF02A-30 TaxID=2250580 RepID=UPI000DEAC99C|nr:DUF4245 domain-containing protein [Blastococcus sp. TF02A-30]RBY89520.1 DUF4245 domain-containing protein [Blastococcus sp. TF02A-30]
MTEAGPPSPSPASPREEEPAAPPLSPAQQRANSFTAANMLRSLLPLVVICLLLVGWQAFRSGPDEGVRVVDPASTVRLATERAGYPVQAPEGLDEDFRPTSARTDAGNATEGDSVTLEIGYLTPGEEFAGFVVSDDRRADPVLAVLLDATEEGTEEIGGQQWTRWTTERGETALSRESEGVVVVVSGSASDDELRTVAAAVRPVEG